MACLFKKKKTNKIYRSISIINKIFCRNFRLFYIKVNFIRFSFRYFVNNMAAKTSLFTKFYFSFSLLLLCSLQINITTAQEPETGTYYNNIPFVELWLEAVVTKWFNLILRFAQTHTAIFIPQNILCGTANSLCITYINIAYR